ncbi:MAG: type II secretion system protein GspG [Verrucomicrobiota bacterium]
MTEKQSTYNFTLIELLAVIAIIGILAGIVISVSNLAGSQASISKCKSQMSQLETALQQYKDDQGYYPVQDDSDDEPFTWDVLHENEPDSTDDPYIDPDQFDINQDNELIDPFGAAFRYRYPGDHNTDSYDLWSYGPDGESSEEEEKKDDITNW